jgi:2-polyprenyl-6-methoxyphenol hydroxylase-like FAD-dependent oxidoreductase
MKALIIGGGITGPVAALALRKAGIEAEIFEAYEHSADNVGGWLMIAPNGINALGVIGAAERVRAIGRPNLRMVMADGTGKRFGAFDELDPHNPSQLLVRSELFQVLIDQAAAQDIEIQYGKRLVDATETAEGVTAHFADGTTATGDLLIGADGVRSRVRTLIDPNAPGPRYTGLLGFGGSAPGGLTDAKPDEFYFAQGKRGFFGYALTPEGETGWFTNVPTREPLTGEQARKTSQAEWLRRMREIYGDDYPAHDVLAKADPDSVLVLGAMQIMPSVPRWHSDRMVLVGDAVHAPSNSTGQGASLSIESAVELARCLRDLPLPQALDAYERLRRPRVEKVIAHGERANQQKTAGPIGRVVTGLLAPIALKTFLSPERMFGWQHRYRIDWDAKLAA